MVKLQKGTWTQYLGIWKRLLCFVFRTAQPDYSTEYPTMLSYHYTTEQLSNLDRIIQWLQVELKYRDQQWSTELDGLTLLLCISHLDHTLKGDLFDSAVVGFFAVMAVDPKRHIFL